MNCLEFRSVGITLSVSVSPADNEYGLGVTGSAEITIPKATDKKTLIGFDCGKSVYGTAPYVAMRAGICGSERFTLVTNSPMYGSFSTVGEDAQELFLDWGGGGVVTNYLNSGQHPVPPIRNPDSFNPVPNDPYYARAKKIHNAPLLLYPAGIFFGAYTYLEPGMDPMTGGEVLDPVSGMPLTTAGYYYSIFAFGNLSDEYNDGSTAELYFFNSPGIVVGAASLSLNITS